MVGHTLSFDNSRVEVQKHLPVFRPAIALGGSSKVEEGSYKLQDVDSQEKMAVTHRELLKEFKRGIRSCDK